MIKENSVVISTKGKDINTIYIVLKKDNNFVYLFDGKSRLKDSLKKKNIHHIKLLKVVENLDFNSMENCDIIFWLKKFKSNYSLGGIN